MGCIKQAMLCSELTIVRLELCRNFLVSHKFAFHVLVRFMSQVILFFWSGERVYAATQGCSENFDKIIRRTEVMEHFLRKVVELQPESF